MLQLAATRYGRLGDASTTRLLCLIEKLRRHLHGDLTRCIHEQILPYSGPVLGMVFIRAHCGFKNGSPGYIRTSNPSVNSLETKFITTCRSRGRTKGISKY
jgi:hypothetical protein